MVDPRNGKENVLMLYFARNCDEHRCAGGCMQQYADGAGPANLPGALKLRHLDAMCGRLRKGEEPRFPINVGGEIDGSSASIRIYGDALDPTELTELLGTAPTVARRKGEPIPGRRRPMLAKTGSWRLESQLDEKAPLNDKVKDLLDRTTDDLAVWAAVTDRYRVDLFCGIYVGEWNRGFGLSVETLQRLAQRRIPVCFDIYADVHFPEEGLHFESNEEA